MLCLTIPIRVMLVASGQPPALQDRQYILSGLQSIDACMVNSGFICFISALCVVWFKMVILLLRRFLTAGMPRQELSYLTGAQCLGVVPLCIVQRVHTVFSTCAGLLCQCTGILCLLHLPQAEPEPGPVPHLA